MRSAPDLTGRPTRIGEQIVEHNAAAITALCLELTSTYCAFEEPDHSVELHKAIERRVRNVVAAAAGDVIDEVHQEIRRLRNGPHPYPPHDDWVAERLVEEL